MEPPHWSLCWISWINFTPSYPFSLRYISILSSNLSRGLPSGLSLSGPSIHFVNIYHVSYACNMYRSSQHSQFDHISNRPMGVTTNYATLRILADNSSSETLNEFILNLVYLVAPKLCCFLSVHFMLLCGVWPDTEFISAANEHRYKGFIRNRWECFWKMFQSGTQV